MRKLQKQGKRSRITKKLLIGTLVAGLTILPGCKTTNNIPNQFKNKQPIVDNMDNKEDLSKVVPVKKEEKKEEPTKIKQEEKQEKKQEAIGIGEIQGIEGFEHEPVKLKKVKRIH